MNQPIEINSSSEPEAPINLSTKLAFGAGDMGAGLTANLVTFSFLIFLTNVAGLSPTLAGTVLLIGKIWDGINDPLIGFLSDRTRSRWGRRYPWMLFGSIPFGLSFALMWIVPDFGGSTTARFWYYVIVSVVFFATYTAVNLPYTALTAELTQDYDERTSLSSFRLAFSLGGAVLGLALGFIFATILPDIQQQYLWLGIICAVISIFPLYWCIWGTRERLAYNQQRRHQLTHGEDSQDLLPFKEQLKIVFSNRPFLFVIGIYLLSWLALQVTAAIIPYFVTNWMGLDSYFAVALVVQGCAIPMLFLCSRMSRHVGKRGIYFIGMSLWIVVQAGLVFLQPGQTALMYFLAFAASLGVATAYVVPWSMLPDVIELDELRTGQRREGVFYSFMTLLQKLGLAVGIFLVGQALDMAGFIPTTPGQPIPTQPDSALLAIRLAIGPLPTICLIAGLVLVYFYPLTREIHAEIILKLKERQQNSTREPRDLS